MGCSIDPTETPYQMFALGQTLRQVRAMSAVAPIADKRWCNWIVRFVPRTDIPASIQSPVGAGPAVPMPMKSASGRSRTNVAEAASISQLVLALRTLDLQSS
jgi:hypothetical protein